MRVTRHGDHLVQLTRWAAVFPMNCYLVLEDDGLTLVDSTMSSPAADVSRVASELGLTLRRIALTHAHGDHVGGVAGVREGYPGIVVSIGERDSRLLAGGRTPGRAGGLGGFGGRSGGGGPPGAGGGPHAGPGRAPAACQGMVPEGRLE